MSDLISDPPRDPFANYEPKGVRFTSGGREWLLVQEPGYHFDGWLCRRHPDGQWVSMRKATDEDKATLAGVTTVAAPSSSAEPAPPQQVASPELIAAAHHAREAGFDRFCLQCLDGFNGKACPRCDESRGAPVQEEATPTLDAAILAETARFLDALHEYDQFHSTVATQAEMAAAIRRLQASLAGSIFERERLAAQLLDFENREAACCPEDVGFEEYIATLRETVANLTRDKAQLTEDIRREQDAHFHTGRERDRFASDIRAHKSWGKHL